MKQLIEALRYKSNRCGFRSL